MIFTAVWLIRYRAAFPERTLETVETEYPVRSEIVKIVSLAAKDAVNFYAKVVNSSIF